MAEFDVSKHEKFLEFIAWLSKCPVQYDYSHEIDNKDDTQAYWYFIFNHEKS